ncbi:MAG: GDSL-type esterase/lipase family protein [Planctomycetaceae bacterium]
MTLPHSQAANRRDFLKTAALVGAGGLVGASVLSAADTTTEISDTLPKRTPEQSVLEPDNPKVILFQGDSITDAGRDRAKGETPNELAPMGKGYAWLAAANLLTTHPSGSLKIYNRGNSGNKVYQLADRWEADCLDLKPDVLSILIGVNDIWHFLNGKYDGTVEVYEKDYHALLKRTKEKLPNVKLIVCEPFVLKCGAVNEKWFPLFDEFRAAAKRVATEAKAVFVPFQTMFDDAVKYAPPEHWAGDGVHPTTHGASLMAHHWMAAYIEMQKPILYQPL